MISQEYLKTIIYYNPETGLINKLKNACPQRKNKVIRKSKDFYLHLEIDGLVFRQHRLAWLYMTGDCPKYIDHINGIKSDNRFCNLRCASSSQNIQNVGKRITNSSGYKGVSYEDKKRKWRAKIGINYKIIHSGYFNCSTAAHFAYCRAAKKYHGEFARTE